MRVGFNLTARKNDGEFVLTASASSDVTVQLSAKTRNSNDVHQLASLKLSAGKGLSSVKIPMPKNDAWSGTIELIQLQFDGQPGTTITIDSIAIE
jgi:hypothetical protein